MSGSLELGEVGGAEGVSEGGLAGPYGGAVAAAAVEVVADEAPQRADEGGGDAVDEGAVEAGRGRGHLTPRDCMTMHEGVR